MVGESRSRAAKLCNFCKEVPASVFCRADSAFLCAPCDDRVHSANKLASRHARVWICEVCEQAPAAFTCKADAAALCASCDRDIHSANSLASRHERIPVIPFYDAASASKSTGPPATGEFSEEEVEAASWLLPDPDCKAAVEDLNSPGYTSAEYLFNEMDNHYLDLDLIAGGQKPGHHADGVDEKQVYSSDGVVPVQHKSELNSSVQYPGPAVNGYPSYDVEYPSPKPLVYSFSSQAISHSVSSSSIDVGVVPDQGDVSTTHWKNDVGSDGAPTPVSGVDREARVLRYREKRKNRRFEKTIRYASRKAYAETRPRIKGRFAKRTELDVDWLVHQDPSYGVVPSS